MAELKQTIPGIFYYDTLPETARPASRQDFYDDRGRLKVGMWFLIQGYHEKKFELYQVRKGFDPERIRPWMDDGRVFIRG